MSSPRGSAARGFIFQASYRIRERVPVVHLFGRLEQGDTFLVRDHRRTPSFYVAAADAARARELGATRQCPTPKSTFAGAQVTRIDVRTPPDAPVLRDRPACARDRHVRSGLSVSPCVSLLTTTSGAVLRSAATRSGARASTGCSTIRRSRRAEVDVEPRVLSFDIETDPRARRLLAISLYGHGIDEVLIVDSSGRAMPERAVALRRRSSGPSRCSAAASPRSTRTYSPVGTWSISICGSFRGSPHG